MEHGATMRGMSAISSELALTNMPARLYTVYF